MSTLTMIRLLVAASLGTLFAAALVTPVAQGDPTWANTLVGVASVGYLVSLVLLLAGSDKAKWLFLPSIALSLLGLPFAAYPEGTLNATYDLTMYISGFLNGAIAVLLHRKPVGD